MREKLQFVDLDPDRVMEQLPSELSGGMRKRAGIARGMANNPEVMLYDEPTSGLDPLTTGTITRLIMKLQRELNVTSVVVSHDIRSVFRMATKVAVLNERRIAFFGTPEEMAASDDKYLRDFLGGNATVVTAANGKYRGVLLPWQEAQAPPAGTTARCG